MIRRNKLKVRPVHERMKLHDRIVLICVSSVYDELFTSDAFVAI